jgi:circadian clock protein KaiB
MAIAVAPSFKGIALFTPGGDCAYCIDEQKRAHWHLDLCAALQTQLGLPEPPYFLLPCFTATVDRWVDPISHQVVIAAEAYPRVLRYQPLLNALFGLGSLQWQPNYSSAEACSVALIDSYRTAFPQLWVCHDLVMGLDKARPGAIAAPLADIPAPQPHRFQLFVNGAETAAAEQMLRLLHKTLEARLTGNYRLQVIDVVTHPNEAEAANISATPTLIQLYPEPVRRVVGKVDSQEQLLRLLSAE